MVKNKFWELQKKTLFNKNIIIVSPFLKKRVFLA